MLRCGQMMLAQALVNRHIGRDWRWIKNKAEPKYEEILSYFLDRKESRYSIHQIACMGVSENKKIGSWFGPNTIGHVMRKLAGCYGDSNLVIHVAMDNTVITNDIKTQCKCSCKRKEENDLEGSDSADRDSLGSHSTFDRESVGSHSTFDRGSLGSHSTFSRDSACAKCIDGWRPLLLMIPLRLGLSNINEVYYEALKFSLTMSQSVGIIGGKPNHAYWFIGHIDNHLLYLDPHLTQNVVEVEENSPIPDDTYHCNYVSRMSISEMDPSLAIGFFCQSEAQFSDWQRAMNNRHNETKAASMFEVVVERPKHWPSIHRIDSNNCSYLQYKSDDTIEDNRNYDSTDEEFELI